MMQTITKILTKILKENLFIRLNRRHRLLKIQALKIRTLKTMMMMIKETKIISMST